MSDIPPEQASTRDASKAVGGILGMLVPTLLSQIADQSDPNTRQRSAPLDYVKSRIPGLRETLPSRGPKR